MKGFTLIEILATLAILTLISLAVFPNIQPLIGQNQFATDTNQLIRALHLARITAINQQKTTHLCASNNGIVCTQTKNWSDGYLIMLNDQPLSYFKGPRTNGELKYTHNHVKFDANGYATGYNGTFYYYNNLLQKQCAIIVNNGGRVRIAKNSDINEIN